MSKIKQVVLFLIVNLSKTDKAVQKYKAKGKHKIIRNQKNQNKVRKVLY